MRLGILATTAVAALALPVSGAHAAVISYDAGGALVFTAGPGETNRTSIQDGDDSTHVVLYDGNNQLTQPLPSGCTSLDDADVNVRCAVSGAGVTLDLGDQNDTGILSIGTAAVVPVHIVGGAGNDTLAQNATDNRSAVLEGGSGDDTLTGGDGNDTLDGGDGNDSLDGQGGDDRVLGGAGDDHVQGDHFEDPGHDVIDGGPGTDILENDYVSRFTDVQPAINLTLGGGADDGRPGEGDDVRGIEHVELSAAGSYVGTDAPETIKLVQVGASSIAGGGGDDQLFGSGGADTIDGGAGNDTINGGFGDDTITGGPGRDVIVADATDTSCWGAWCSYPYGNDTINVRDGEVDSVSCGAGSDRVIADPADSVAGDCESVDRGAATGRTDSDAKPDSAGPPAGGDTNAPAGPKLALISVKRLRLSVDAPAAGTLTVKATSKGRTLATGSATARKAGRITLTLKRAKALRQPTKLTLRLSFKPSRGARSTVTQTVRLG